MSPNQIKTKAEKYRKEFAQMFVVSSLKGGKGIELHVKHSTIRDLLNFFSELSGTDTQGEG